MNIKKIILIKLLFLAFNFIFPDHYANKKILYIDSYHEGYEWSDKKGQIYINLKLANKLGYALKPSLLKMTNIIK